MFEASLGPTQHHHHLTLFPILAEEERIQPYLLMADALATGVLTIHEVGDGQVPFLQAMNRALDPVLILDGEQLIGAKQNRMTNRSIILPPESMTKIPVSCMEHGRWHFVGDDFAAAPQHAPSKVRRKARETEARSAMRDREARAQGREVRSSFRDLAQAQGEVWDEIQEVSANLGSRSETGALNSVFEDRRPEMEGWLQAFPCLPDQVGLLAFLRGRPVGMDALGASAQYGPLHDRLLRGYVLDAMEGLSPRAPRIKGDRRGGAPVGHSEAEAFLEAMKTASRTPSESVGVGQYHILDGAVLGGELVDGGQLVHLSAFPNLHGNALSDEGSIDTLLPPIARPSHRRRRY